MANTYTWKITQLHRQTSDGFAHTAEYQVIGTSDQSNDAGIPYNATFQNQATLERPETLVAFEDLTEAALVAAIQAQLGEEQVTQVQTTLDNFISEVITPTQASGLPAAWSA